MVDSDIGYNFPSPLKQLDCFAAVEFHFQDVELSANLVDLTMSVGIAALILPQQLPSSDLATGNKEPAGAHHRCRGEGKTAKSRYRVVVSWTVAGGGQERVMGGRRVSDTSWPGARQTDQRSLVRPMNPDTAQTGGADSSPGQKEQRCVATQPQL